VRARIDASAVPLLEGARECSAMGVHTGGEGRNREWAGTYVAAAPGVDSNTLDLLYDPQTSGGLLIACPRRRARALEAAFTADGEPIWRIGEVGSGEAGIDVR
jgi:selenide,water dikinase